MAAAKAQNEPENMVPIMIVLGIMFLGICIAMNLFSRARFKKRTNAFAVGARGATPARRSNRGRGSSIGGGGGSSSPRPPMDSHRTSYCPQSPLSATQLGLMPNHQPQPQPHHQQQQVTKSLLVAAGQPPTTVVQQSAGGVSRLQRQNSSSVACARPPQVTAPGSAVSRITQQHQQQLHHKASQAKASMAFNA